MAVAALLVAHAIPARAQETPDFADAPTGQPSVAAIDGAAALYLNPAAIGALLTRGT